MLIYDDWWLMTDADADADDEQMGRWADADADMPMPSFLGRSFYYVF